MLLAFIILIGLRIVANHLGIIYLCQMYDYILHIFTILTVFVWGCIRQKVFYDSFNYLKDLNSFKRETSSEITTFIF